MKPSILYTVTACSLLAACGGGNGKDNGSAPPPATMNITSGNAVMVTGVSYRAAVAAGSLGEVSTGTGLFASGPANVSKIDGSFATGGHSGGNTGFVPIPPTVDNCIPSGTMTVSGEIADPFTPTLTPGDYFDVVFDMCDDGVIVTDGDLHYVVDAFSGDFFGGVYDLTMTATLSNFQVATADDVLTSNGDATIRLYTVLSPVVDIEVSGMSLTTDRNASSETLSNFSSLHSQDAGDAQMPYTRLSSGTLDSTRLAGAVDYSTPLMFEGYGSDYPHSGVFLVTGASSSARLTAIDNVNVRIEIDSDGDGTVDASIDSTWAELEGA